MNSNNPPIAIHCQDIKKSYGTGDARVEALREINLDIYQGELLMIMGPSGCGKTTLISIITSILNQDEGICEVFGQNLAEMNQKQRLQFRGSTIGFVFQMFNLLPALSLLENVSIPLLINEKMPATAQKKSFEALKLVGIENRKNALPSELSGGQQQRVAIARAIVHDPRLIVCDEPTSNLDRKSGHEMIKILKHIAKQPNRALVIVTHDERILEFADRIAFMEDGRIKNIVINKNREPES